MQFAVTPVIPWIIVVYLAFILIFGIVMSRRAKTMSDYYIAGKKAPAFIAIVSGSAAIMSGFGLVGIPGLTYQFGVVADWIQIPAILGFSVAAFFIARKMRTLAEVREVYSVPDAIALRYTRFPTAARIMGVLGLLSGLLGYLSVEFMALGVVMSSIFPISLWTGVLIGTAIVGIYTILGGIAAGIWTDLIQFSMEMLAGISILIASFVVAGGPVGILRTFASSAVPKWQYHAALWWPAGGLGIWAALAWVLTFTFGHMGQPQLLSKYYCHRDIAKMKWQALGNGITYSLAGLVSFAGLALAALVAAGKVAPLANSNYAVPYFLIHYIPSGIAGLVFAALIAASMATTNGFANIASAALTRDLMQKTFNVKMDEKSGLMWGRFWTFILIIVALVVTYYWKTLIGFAGSAAWSTLASVFLPLVSIGLNWRRATSYGAVAGAAVGIFTSLYFTVANYNPSGFFGSSLAIVLSVAVFIVVSLVTPPDELPADVEAIVGMNEYAPSAVQPAMVQKAG
ncbi:MAG: sodium/proline symporter [Peptococcaceae bacterium]|nr:sodium/proline symporter [Peptococcaceae bacterium]